MMRTSSFAWLLCGVLGLTHAIADTVPTQQGLLEEVSQEGACSDNTEANYLLQTEHGRVSVGAGRDGGSAVSSSEDCGVVKFSAASLLGKNGSVPIGTHDNLKAPPGIDFTGIWWISWTNHPGLGWAYDRLGIEEGWTFIGMTTNSSEYPVRVSIPSGGARRWMFTDSFPSKIGQYFKASSNPHGSLNGVFHNATHGELFPPSSYYRWPIYKTDDDTWQRPTVFTGGMTITYTLKRIVYANGEPNWKYWPGFVGDLMLSDWSLMSYGTDDKCMRECQTKANLWWNLFSNFLLDKTCEDCKKQCANKSKK